MRLFVAAGIVFSLALATPSALLADSAAYTFESVPTGTLTPFSDTNNGITATFTSDNGDPGAFGVTDSTIFGFVTLSGNILMSPGDFLDQNTNEPLNIAFSKDLYNLYLNFALVGSPSDTLTVTAFENATSVGSVTVAASGPANLFPEGFLGFNGVLFNSVTLTADASTPYFAVDNLAVSTTPEPGTLSLLGTGLLGLAGFSLRRLIART